MGTTLIKNAAWAVCWDDAARRQVYRRDVDIAFANDLIVHVGAGYRGAAETVVDGRDRLVMPGLVNVHTHCMSENIGRGITEELGNPQLYMSGLYDLKSVFLPAHSMELSADQLDGVHAATEVALGELLRSGVTTVVDQAVPYEGWIELLAKSGIRAYAGPMYRSARWVVKTGHAVEYDWDEKAGERAFAAALTAIEAAQGHNSGRLSGIVAPAQVDNCTPQLLRDSLAEAEKRGLPLTLHCSQSVWEFLEMTRRHGVSPVQWLAQLGLLGPRMLLGHAVFLDQHSWLRWPTRRDIELLAETGTSVAHCPTVFSRYGQTLEGFGAYRQAGVNMALGTDTQPHNMIEEMRHAIILGRIAAREVHALTSADVFHAATVGGATALGRGDLGRIAVGAKADLVLADLSEPAMQPARDPLRSLIFSAAERAIREVYVDGRRVVADGEPLHIDRRAVAARLSIAQRKVLEAAPKHDYAHRSADVISPPTLPMG